MGVVDQIPQSEGVKAGLRGDRLNLLCQNIENTTHLVISLPRCRCYPHRRATLFLPSCFCQKGLSRYLVNVEA